jgi:hypothetical protein
VVLAVAEPPVPSAVSLYVVVEDGCTCRLPESATSPIPSIETSFASRVDQVSVEVWPAVIDEGLAVKLEMLGRGADGVGVGPGVGPGFPGSGVGVGAAFAAGTCTMTSTPDEAEAPRRSVARTLRRTAPPASPARHCPWQESVDEAENVPLGAVQAHDQVSPSASLTVAATAAEAPATTVEG